MKKLSGILTTVAFLISFSLYANEGTAVASEKSQVLEKVKLEGGIDSKVNCEINEVLRENIKKHRYSKDFELIMVNDRIKDKYERINYMTYKYFKYDVDFAAISESLTDTR